MPSVYRFKQLLLLSLFCHLWMVPLIAVDLKPRVIVETDIGGDSDDQASLVRLLVYSNEFDLEGIIVDRSDAKFQVDGLASNPTGAVNAQDMAYDYIDAYGQVRNNLTLHAVGYPSVAFLKSITKRGQNTDSDGVNLLITAGDKADSRPIWYGNWGSNSGTISNLKRAFDQVKATRSDAAYRTFVQKFRICTLDGSGATRQGHDSVIAMHIETGFPDMDNGRWYHRFRSLVGASATDVTTRHGALGAIWPGPKEGDTWTFLHVIPIGLSDPEQPAMGGWAGRYRQRGTYADGKHWWCDQRDAFNGSTNRDNTVVRWNQAARRDFAARMDWCVKSFHQANHPSTVVVDGHAGRSLVYRIATVGSTLALSAAGSSDPDAGQTLTINWSQYREAGTYAGAVAITKTSATNSSVAIPGDAAGKTIHMICEVSDSGTPSLTRYRRVIITAQAAAANTPPKVSISVPSSAVAPAAIVVSATASDDDGSIAKVEFYQGNQKIGEDSSAPYQYTWNNVAAGTYIITAKAFDLQGASTTSASKTVTVTVPVATPDPIAINFQPAMAPTVAGYRVDSGEVYAARHGQVYGWNVSNYTTRDRNKNNDQLVDTLIHMQKTTGLVWELAVPNGTYQVTITCGDSGYTDQVNSLTIEGTVALDTDGQDPFDVHTVSVSVTDGRLTIRPAAGANNAKLCCIVVESLPSGNG